MRVQVRPSLLCHLFVAVALGALAVGCTDKPKTSDQDIKQVLYNDVLAFRQDKKRRPVVILDPRPEARYAQGHIPGAINIPMPSIIEGHPDLANARTIIVYGTGWTDYISPAAAKRLMALGYQNVYDFRGGVELWRAEGGRVDSTEPPATQPAAANP